jgi:ferredoxin
MKVKIARKSCTIKCAACYRDCSEFFKENPDDNYSQIAEPYRIQGHIDEGEVPESLLNNVVQAADECPYDIIHIIKI